MPCDFRARLSISLHALNPLPVGKHSQDRSQSQFQEHEMFQLLWETRASWHRETRPVLSRDCDYPLHLLPPQSPAPAGGHSPETLMRPISRQACRNQEETRHTIPCLARYRNGVLLRGAQANEEIQDPRASPQGTVELAAWATSPDKSGRARWNHSGPPPLQEDQFQPRQGPQAGA